MHLQDKLFRKSHFYKSMLLFGVITIFTILVVFFSMMLKFEDTAIKLTDSYNQKLFESIISRADSIDKMAVNMLLGLNSTSPVSTLKFTIFDDEEIYRSVNLINNMLRYNIDALESCYICNFFNDRIYLLGTRCGYYSEDSFFDKDILEILDGHTFFDNITKKPITRTLYDENGNAKEVYTYIHADTFNEHGVATDAIILNISINDSYSDLIGENTELCIIDKDKRILKNFGSRPDAVYQDLILLLDLKPQAKSYQTVEIDDTEYLVTRAYLTQNDWTVISFTPIESLFAPIKATKKILNIALIIILILAMLSSYTISNYLYQPIKVLLAKLPKNEGINEFKVIQEYIKDKDTELEYLSEKLADGQPYIKLRFLADLLKNPLEGTLLEQKVATISFNLPMKGNFCILKVRIDNKTNYLKTFSYLEQMNLRNYLLSDMVQKLNATFATEYHYTHDYTNFIIVISCLDGKENDREKLLSIIQEQQKNFKKSTRFSISAILSSNFNNLNELHIEYKKIERIEQESFFNTPEMIYFPEDVKVRNSDIDISNLPYNELYETIICQKEDAFKVCIETCFEIISTTEKENARHLVLALHYTIFKAIRQFQKSSKIDPSLDNLNNLDKINNLDFLLDIKNELIDIGLQAIVIMNEFRTNDKVRLIEKMHTFIEENYRNKNLSSALIADNFTLSNAYTNKIFKTITGDSLLHAINSLRLEKAADLLQSTRLTVDEITEEVGWDNTKHFFQKFKAYYGLTPKEWRTR